VCTDSQGKTKLQLNSHRPDSVFLNCSDFPILHHPPFQTAPTQMELDSSHY
jgi:hypothetical protein